MASEQNRPRGNNREETPAKSLVSAPLAGVASLILPGLGQALARELNRGLVFFGSLISVLGLLAWRMRLLARFETGWASIFLKAIRRRPAFIGVMLLGAVGLWLWIARDAYLRAKRGSHTGLAPLILILLLFFLLGWQISEIDLYKAVSELPDTLPILGKVMWPWQAAVTREEATVSAGADILVPCGESEPPPIPEKVPGEPYLKAEPTCGSLSEQDENYEVVPGTELTLTGSGFKPNTQTELFWVDPIGNEFRLREEGDYVQFMTDDEGGFQTTVTMPYRLIPPSSAGDQIHRIEARQTSTVGPLVASEALLLSIEKMIETIFLGMMATGFGIILAVPVSFLAARNLMSGSWFTLGVYYVTRGILNIVRSIEPLIWAIIATQWVGLGPFAGIIALTVHTVAALGKLYSESIESIDPGPIEAVQATGATQLQTIMFAVVPQMIPPFVSFSIYRWDINVRMSTVIGLVGGGGIGFLLVQYIRLFNFRAAGIAVWFIAVTVAILDYVSAEIRERYV